MRSSEAAQKKQTPIYSGLTITNKQRTKVLKYLLADRYYICKYFSFDDEKSLKQARNFLIWRERGKAIMFDPSSEQSLYLKIDMPYLESVNILQQQNLPRLIRNLIGKLILATNLNLYSIDNIMNNPISGEVSLNNISIVGILALWKQTEFAFEQFKEIFELLTVEVFDEPTFDRKFPYKLKFRALGMLILKHICRKDISLLKAIFKQNIPSKIGFTEGRQLCKKLPELFRAILLTHEIRKKILDAQKRDSLSYGSFLQQVFLETQLSGKQTLDWQRVISLLIPGSLASKDSHTNEFLKDLQYIFMEYYNSLNDQTKQQLRSLGIQLKDWQILFKLSIGQDALDLNLQQYFKQAQNARLNRQIIETTILAIASTRHLISKSLYQCLDVMRNSSYSSEENISTNNAYTQNFGNPTPQGKQTNIQKMDLSEKSQLSVAQNASQQSQPQGMAFEVQQIVRVEEQIEKESLYNGKDSEDNGQSLSNKVRSISFHSSSSLQSLYYLQGEMNSFERGISEKQIKILRNMGKKFREIEIQLQNTMIKALHPKIKMLNTFLKLSG